MDRARLVLASTVMICAAGCGQSTEIPLAKVAPVTVAPQSAKLKPKAGMSVSPAHIEGHN